MGKCMGLFLRFRCEPSPPVGKLAHCHPAAPGGATDITARLMGQWLSERLGQQFVIDNRPGGGGNVGSGCGARPIATQAVGLIIKVHERKHSPAQTMSSRTKNRRHRASRRTSWRTILRPVSAHRESRSTYGWCPNWL